jgi:hypothetical protein
LATGCTGFPIEESTPIAFDSILRMIWSRIEISLRAFRRGRKR